MNERQPYKSHDRIPVLMQTTNQTQIMKPSQILRKCKLAYESFLIECESEFVTYEKLLSYAKSKNLAHGICNWLKEEYQVKFDDLPETYIATIPGDCQTIEKMIESIEKRITFLDKKIRVHAEKERLASEPRETEDHSELEDRISNIRSESTTRAIYMNAMKWKNRAEQLQTAYNNLDEANRGYEKKIKDMEHIYQRRISELINENAGLTENNASLKARNVALMNDNVTLMNDNQEMIKKNESCNDILALIPAEGDGGPEDVKEWIWYAKKCIEMNDGLREESNTLFNKVRDLELANSNLKTQLERSSHFSNEEPWEALLESIPGYLINQRSLVHANNWIESAKDMLNVATFIPFEDWAKQEGWTWNDDINRYVTKTKDGEGYFIDETGLAERYNEAHSAWFASLSFIKTGEGFSGTHNR